MEKRPEIINWSDIIFATMTVIAILATAIAVTERLQLIRADARAAELQALMEMRVKVSVSKHDLALRCK